MIEFYDRLERYLDPDPVHGEYAERGRCAPSITTNASAWILTSGPKREQSLTALHLERHHLFPRGWLERQGVTDLKKINQLANFALLEWLDNIEISDAPPAEYVPKIRDDDRISFDQWIRMCELHALPENWHQMPYESFLHERRKLMAGIIRRGFETLK